MHLQNQEALVRHRIEVAVEAIDDHDVRIFSLDATPNGVGKLPRSHFGWVDLPDLYQAVIEAFLKWKPQRLGTRAHRAAPFIESEYHRALVPGCGGDRIGERK